MVSTRAFVAVTLLSVLMIVSGLASAASLTADAYPATGPQPSSADWTSDGTTWKPCTIAARVPSCDLTTVGAPGNYSLRMRYNYVAGCLGEVCWATGAAASVPFAFVWQGTPAQAPTNLTIKP